MNLYGREGKQSKPMSFGRAACWWGQLSPCCSASSAGVKPCQTTTRCQQSSRMEDGATFLPNPGFPAAQQVPQASSLCLP